MAPRSWEFDPAWYADWLAGEAAYWRGRPLPEGPTVSIVMPCYNTDAGLLREAVGSVIAQTYPQWELCLADDGSSDPATIAVLDDLNAGDFRIRLARLPENRGIAAASNAALALATGAFVVPMDHDDLLPDHALAALVHYLVARPETRFAYSDADRIDARGARVRPFFKPDWNYDLFLAQNYLNHLTAIDAQLLADLGGWREGYEGSQDYDLYLRATEVLDASQILHIPHVLYHWREVGSSFSRSRLGSAVAAGRRAIESHLQRLGRRAVVTAPPGALIYNRVRWQPPSPCPRVILLLLGPASAAMKAMQREPVEWGEGLSLNVLPVPEGASSAAVDTALGSAPEFDCALLLNAGATELPTALLQDWVGRTLQADAGCVGLKVVDGRGLLIAGPESLSPERESDLYEGLWRGADARSRGYFAHLLLHQATQCLLPDAVAVRREHLDSHGGFSHYHESLHLAVAGLCLAAARRGYHAVWEGALTVACEFGSLPESYRPGELQRFRTEWQWQLTGSRFTGRDGALVAQES